METTGREKLQYTVVLTAGVLQKDSSGWEAIHLPPMMIFKNLVNAPKGQFPKDFVVVGSKGGTMTSEFMVKEYIPKIISRRPGALFKSKKTLLILDSARANLTDEVKEKMKKEKIDWKAIDPGMTKLIQFMDTHINKGFKGALRECWDEWIDEVQYTESGKRKQASYEEIMRWTDESWRKVACPELIIKGLRENGYVDYMGGYDSLHSSLCETILSRSVPMELIEEVHRYLQQMAQMDKDEAGNAGVEEENEEENEENFEFDIVLEDAAEFGLTLDEEEEEDEDEEVEEEIDIMD